MDKFSRTINLIGLDNFEKIKSAKVAIFGLGGVGGYVLEGLIRLGVQEIWLFDGDVVDISNINRQILATKETIGLDKVEVAKQRCLSINENCKIFANKIFITKENISQINFSQFNYVFDAIDTITSKVEIIKECKKANVEVISCMGTGNKFDPTLFEVDDVFNTSICPLSKIMRKLLRENNVNSLKVVYSKEVPKKNQERIPASISFVPSVAGLIMVREFYNYITNK